MRHSKLHNFLSTISLFLTHIRLFGQKLEPKRITIDPDTTIVSKIMGKDYQLYLSFPKDYSTTNSIKYPVLYLLDGSSNIALIKSICESMEIAEELEDVLIVGISSGRDEVAMGLTRTNDYTTSKDATWDRQYEKDVAKQYKLPYNALTGEIQSGGAAKFLQSITTEIIPYIDSQYKTTNDRGISGHSLGGLFTAWCFINTKGIFTRFGINSASLWWKNDEVITQAATFFNSNETLDIPASQIFISVGQREPSNMILGMEKFSTLLESKAYNNVTVTKQKFSGKTHLSVIGPSLRRTLAVLYGKNDAEKSG